MSATRRHGPGWAAVGDAAGLINPMNGEGIDYGLESGMLLADLFLADPSGAPAAYDRLLGERFDEFLRTGRRFSFLIGHRWILRQRPAGGRRHAGGGRHHPAGDGQPHRRRHPGNGVAGAGRGRPRPEAGGPAAAPHPGRGLSIAVGTGKRPSDP